MRGGGGQRWLAGCPPHDLGNVALDHVYRQNNADLPEEHVTDYVRKLVGFDANLSERVVRRLVKLTWDYLRP
jgi:hypothetical protein